MNSLPPKLRSLISAREAEAVTVGCSTMSVLRLVAPGQDTLYVKACGEARCAEIDAEHARMAWLSGRLPVPRVLDSGCEEGVAWLLTTEIEGVALSDEPFRNSPLEVARLLADGLKPFHALPVGECPFDMRLAHMTEIAGKRVRAGEVDEPEFDDERRGRSAADVYDELLRTRPAAEDLVVAHGDYCLPNIIARSGRVAGFIDLGRMGVSDRDRDLALAARSLVYNGHTEAAPALFQACGVEPDDTKIRYYSLLDEFF